MRAARVFGQVPFQFFRAGSVVVDYFSDTVRRHVRSLVFPRVGQIDRSVRNGSAGLFRVIAYRFVIHNFIVR